MIFNVIVSKTLLDLCIQVLDVSKFMLEHPGGKRVIMMSGAALRCSLPFCCKALAFHALRHASSAGTLARTQARSSI